MITNTSYGTWYNHQGHELTVEESVAVALTDYADDYDTDAIASDWRDAINEALPDQVALAGNDFLGPYYEEDFTWEGGAEGLNIREIIEGVDFWEIAARHELVTAEDAGRDILKSQAANPSKVASSTLKRLGVKPHTYRPHPDSGRPQALYKRGEVEAAVKSRPGQGARTDRQDA